MTYKKSKKKGVTEAEKNLWETYTQSTKPLDKTKETEDTPSQKTERRQGHHQHNADDIFHTSSAAPSHNLSVKVSHAVDKNYVTQLKRQQIEIEATLDLHGMTQNEAFPTLKNFIERCYQRGQRFLLVITGKGNNLHRDNVDQLQPGILQSKVPLWLQQDSFAPLIISVTRSLPKHGGGGAFYVHLRRRT